MVSKDVSQVEDRAGNSAEWVGIELPAFEVAEALRLGVGDDSRLTTLISAALVPAKAQGKLISTPTSLPPVCEAVYSPASDELRIEISPLYSARLIVDSATDVIATGLSEFEAAEILRQRATTVDVLRADSTAHPSMAMLIAAALASIRQDNEESILAAMGSQAACRVAYSLSRDELEVSLFPLHRLMVMALFDRACPELGMEDVGDALSLSASSVVRYMSTLVELGVLSEQQKFGLDDL